MKIAVIGSGYVGLVTGACFAEMGNTVTCVDVDENKIARLKEGEIPIYEPGLDQLVEHNYREGRLKFTTSLAEVERGTNIFFIAVGTPPGEDGSADLQYVLAVAADIGRHIDDYAIIVDKSTVPVGTADKVRAATLEQLNKRGAEIPFDVVSNPEFLKEGAAIDDFMHPDRVVIGTDSERAGAVLRELYAPFTRNHERTLVMGIRDAEMTKYAANAMLATKISFMNEIAHLCDLLGVDVENVRQGIGSDKRIGFSFIYPGCGYGGSCFPKDVKALMRTAAENQFDARVLRAVEDRNMLQKHRLFEKITAHYGADLSGRTFALWGLSFKPETDDMREAPSVVLIEDLVGAGAQIVAYDPVATEEARHVIPEQWQSEGRVRFVDHQYDALAGCDALLLVTEWKPFRNPDFDILAERLNERVIFDGRNQYHPVKMRELGFTYVGIGRAS